MTVADHPTNLSIAAVALAFISICLLFTFPGWHGEEENENGEIRQVKPFPSRLVRLNALGSTIFVAIFGLVSMLWQHTASAAAATTAQDLGYGVVKGGVGAKAMALGWVGIAFIALAAIGLLVLIFSVRILDLLTTDD